MAITFILQLQQLEHMITSEQMITQEQMIAQATVLFAAINQGNFDAVQHQLNRNQGLANAQLQNQHPLWVAVNLQDSIANKMCITLLKYGSDPHHRDSNNQTVLFPICHQGKIQCLDLFMTYLSITDTDNLGQTPLFAAAQNNQIDVFQYLDLTAQIINMPDSLIGQTIIFYAASKGYQQLCRLLIERGADYSFVDQCGQMPIDYAELSENAALVKYLRSLPEREQVELQIEDIPSSKQLYRLSKVNIRAQKVYVSDDEIEQLFRKYPHIQRMLQHPQTIPQRHTHVGLNESWRDIGIKIVSKIMKMKCSYWFHQISKSYYKKCGEINSMNRPSDLNTVKLKLVHSCYRTPGHFTRDMNLIWDNCMRLAHKPQILSYAKQLKKMFYDMANNQGFFEYS